jgi:hypothetical protein
MPRSVISRISPRRRIAVLASACALAAVAALALTGAASAGAATSTVPGPTPSCSDATLQGTYNFASDGWSVSGGTATPFALAGTERLDGAGTAAGTVTISQDGVITPATPNTAVYHVNANCTGTAAFTNSGVTTHFDVYAAPSGDSFEFVGTDAGSVTSATETRVAK